MSVVEPSIIEHSVEKTHIWLKDLAEQLGVEDRQYAFRVLRAVLHALRDRAPVDVAAQLAAELPTLIRGVYYENWVPSRTPLAIHDVDAFLARVSEEGHLAGETEASVAVTAVVAVLREHISPGGLADFAAILPASIRALIEG
jgi:uncharacterized protein (DUF2267 family)